MEGWGQIRRDSHDGLLLLRKHPQCEYASLGDTHSQMRRGPHMCSGFIDGEITLGSLLYDQLIKVSPAEKSNKLTKKTLDNVPLSYSLYCKI